MKLQELETSVTQHVGEFRCRQINNKAMTATFSFRHSTMPGIDPSHLPGIGRLRDFYETFGGVLFYLEDQSGDAGKYLAPPSEWDALRDFFLGWLEDLDDEEREELLPEWVDNCLVIGETPQSGNYILMATTGNCTGHVFEFEHDGFEFLHEADNLISYVQKLLVPDSSTLTEIASHMRFALGDRMVQWWIEEMRDNRMHVVKTAA